MEVYIHFKFFHGAPWVIRCCCWVCQTWCWCILFQNFDRKGHVFNCSYLSFIPKAVNMIAGCEDYFCCSCCGRFAIYWFRHSLVQTGLLAPQSRSGKLQVSAMRCFSSCRVLWTKSPWFGYFWAGIWKEYCRISNQHPQIFLIAKFQEKTKMLKFGTKNTLFQYFRAGIWKQYSHI